MNEVVNEGETLSDSWKSSNKKVNNDNENKHCGRQMKRNVKRCQGYPSQVFSGQGHWNQKKWWHNEETKDLSLGEELKSPIRPPKCSFPSYFYKQKISLTSIIKRNQNKESCRRNESCWKEKWILNKSSNWNGRRKSLWRSKNFFILNIIIL